MILKLIRVFISDGGRIVIKVSARRLYACLSIHTYYGIEENTRESSREAILNIFRDEVSHYSRARLHVNRTCTRVIIRILRRLVRELAMHQIDHSWDELVNKSGDFTVLCKLSNQGLVVGGRSLHHVTNDTDEAIIAGNELNDWIREVMLRSRAFQTRTVRISSSPLPPLMKPDKFRHLSTTDGVTAALVEKNKHRKVEGVKMGIELEYSYARGIEGDPEYLCVKHDGSLPVTGRELTTRPDSYEEHIKNLTEWLDYNARNLRVNERCGMHVHVDKKHLQADALASLIDRIYGHRTRYTRIAGRQPNDYWNFERLGGGRYTAVNTGNRDTVEFRLFSGTKSKHKIKRRLQWINAIVSWANKPERKAELVERREEKLRIEKAKRLAEDDRRAVLMNMVARLRTGLTDEIGPFSWENTLLVSRSVGYMAYNPVETAVIGFFPQRNRRNYALTSSSTLVFFCELADVVWIHNGSSCHAIRMPEGLVDRLRAYDATFANRFPVNLSHSQRASVLDF